MKSKKKKGAPGGKKEKIYRPKVALGGLDAELYGDSSDPFRGRKSSKVRVNPKEMTEFDPLKKLRKGGKLGNKSFKSKAKFKRRK